MTDLYRVALHSQVQFILKYRFSGGRTIKYPLARGMGTGSSVCYSDTDIPEYSPAYLGQIYAGVILNSAKSSSTGGYASTLSLNSLYASTLSLNSLCDTKKAASRRNSGNLCQLGGQYLDITRPFHF